VGAALSALELIEEVEPIVPRLNVPTLIIQGKLDTVVEPRNAAWLRDHLGSTRKELVILPRSDHLVAVDRDRERAISLTRDFVLGRGEFFEMADANPPPAAGPGVGSPPGARGRS
jgi:carboxylesterase